MIYHRFELSIGPMIGRINNQGQLSGLWFENQKYYPQIDEEALWSSNNPRVNETIRSLEDQLLRYDQGKLKEFTIDLEPVGTDFQKLVWNILQEIQYGQTMTYGEISKQVAVKMKRDSMSAQAVGSAIGRNPIAIIIPCHRVLGANGTLTGYAGGLDKKKSLLELEGVLFKST